MAYIAPNSAVRLLQGVPLQSDYNDTILFSSLAEQSTYFYSKRAWEGNNYSFVRSDGDSGELKIQASYSTVFACNYLMYSNTSFVDKWFYAFIDSVEYVDDRTVRVRFTIDHMQTWLFAAQLGACYIERAHTPTDEIGQDAGAEDIPVKEYKIINALTSGKMGKMGVLVSSTFDPDQLLAYPGGIYAGTFSGLCYTYFSLLGTGGTYPDASSLIMWINGVETAGKSDGIVNITMIPSGFVTGSGMVPTSTIPKTYTIEFSKNQTALDGYAPKNKRLLSYPYNKLTVSNMQGAETDYRFEQFGGALADDLTKYRFVLYGDCNGDPEIIAMPKYYGGDTVYNGNTQTYTNEGFSHAVSIRGFPQCAWNSDIYKIWLSNKKQQILAGISSDIANLGVSAVISAINPTAGAISAATTAMSIGSRITGAVAENATMARSPARAQGNQSNTIMSELNMLDFVFMTKTIRADQARIIDDYFSMFGYAIKKCQIPNRNARPHWTYIKTIGAKITGNIPADANQKLVSIYDRGVRFWNNPAEIGNFTLNNSPT